MNRHDAIKEARPDVTCDAYIASGFQDELSALLNRYGMDARTATPDFLLAEYVTGNIRLLEEKHRAYMHWSQPQEIKPPPNPTTSQPSGQCQG